jgi:hypothetical protein
MNEWVLIAVAIVAVSVVSGVLRRRFASLRGERRPSKKGAMIESVGTIVIFVIFLFVVLAIIGSMTKQ